MRYKAVFILMTGVALAGCNELSQPGNTASVTVNALAPAPASTGTQRFVNSRANAVSEGLQRNYVDFHFDYPQGWIISPQRNDGTDANFVRVASPLDRGFVAYAFHVGTAYGSGNADSDRRDMERELPGVARRFGSTLTNYEVVRIGPDQIGQYNTMGWHFTARPGTSNDPVTIYGRGDILLPPGARRGVLIITMTTDRSLDIRSTDDIARSAAMRTVFESFRLSRL